MQQPALIRQLKQYQQAYPEYFEISLLILDGLVDSPAVNKTAPLDNMDQSESTFFRVIVAEKR